MNKNLIKKNYKKKIDLFNRYNKKYFDENISEISDFDFDKLKREILDLEKKYNFLKSKKSPLSSVGFKPSKILESFHTKFQCYHYLMHLMRRI